MLNFFKKKDNNDLSINQIRQQIEEEYKKNATLYGSFAFNIQPFYVRYQKILSQDEKTLKNFLISELEALQAYVEKIKEKPPSSSLDKIEKKSVIQKIYDGYDERLKKYPQIFLHSSAFKEIEHLYGCLIQFHESHTHNFFKIRSLLTRPYEQQFYLDLEVFINELFPLLSSKKAIAFENYIFEITKYQNDQEKIEALGQIVLKKTFHMMKAIKKLLDFLKIELERRISTINFVYKKKALKFSEYEDALRTECDQILKDFRLTGFF